MKHARLGPSNVRWPHCAGSVREEAAYPDIPGPAAIDGTGDHLLFELCIKEGVDSADHYIGKIIGKDHLDRPKGWLVEADRVTRINVALNYVRARCRNINTYEVEAEGKVNPGRFFGRDDWWGTCDLTLISDDVIETVDYKGGQMWVEVTNNDQLTDYAAGRLLPYLMQKHGDVPDFDKFKTIRMTIIQPKTSPQVRYEEITPQELWARINIKAQAAHATDDLDAPLTAGAWCQWCKHGRAGNCSEKNKEGIEGMSTILSTGDSGQSDFIAMIGEGTLDLSKIESTKLSAILDVSKSVEKLIKLVNEEALTRIKENANAIPGYVLGEGNGKNTWIDDNTVVEKKLRGMRMKKDEVMIPTLITPAAARKREEFTDRQKLNLEKMIKRVPGKPALKKVTINTKELFKKVEQLPNFM